MEPLKTAKSRSKYPISHALFIVPIPLFVVLAISLHVLGLSDSVIFDPPGLLPVLNLLFLFVCPMFVGYLAAKGYLESGSFSLIILGSGVFSLAFGSLIAGFLLPAEGPNAVITVHNISAFLSGIFHFIGATIVFIGVQPEQDVRKRKFWLVILNSVVFALLVTLTFGVYKHILPTFFIQGQGPTLLRQIILGIAIFSFSASGLLFILIQRNSRSPFLYLYAAALFLISIGLGCIFLQKSFGGPIGWLGRTAQYLGGLYLLAAVFYGAKEVGVKINRLDEILERFFRNRFEILLAERTEELKIKSDFSKMIMETSPVGIIHVDVKGSILYANNRAEEILGIQLSMNEDRTYNDPSWKITGLDGEPFPDENLPFAIIKKSANAVFDVQHAIEWPNGKRVILSINASPFLDNLGTFLGAITTFEDITERKQAENQIKASLKEKETLLQEIHHRVKNNMQVISSLLKLQSNSIEDGRIKDALKESQNRIYAMSAVHEMLHGSENLSTIDLKGYLSKVATSIFQTYNANPSTVKLNISTEEIPINIKQASPLGLVINEVVSNSLTYAFPEDRRGEINVEMKKLGNELELTITDNGIGIPDEVDWKNSNTLGLKLVRTLVEKQLGGSIDMESNNGTKFTIKFNLET